MKNVKFIKLLFLIPLYFFCFFWHFAAQANIEVAAGMISPFSGRVVPAIVLGYSNQAFSAITFSCGVYNKLYYQSSYGVAFFKMWTSGDLLGGTAYSGFGLGGLYSKRGYQDQDSNEEEKKNDFLLGPAFKVNLIYLNFFFLEFDTILGLRNSLGSHLTLNFQDVVVFSVGIRI